MIEDLQSLSWFEIARRVEVAEVAALERLQMVERQTRCIADLRRELKDAEAKNANQLRVIDGLVAELRAAKEHPATPFKTTADGVETWHGLPVLIPVGLIPEGRTPCEVRGLAVGIDKDWISNSGMTIPPWPPLGGLAHVGELRILLADKPAPVDPTPMWTPPASLKDGVYESTPRSLVAQSGATFDHVSMCGWLSDYTAPPACGRWRVTNGKAEWLGDA